MCFSPSSYDMSGEPNDDFDDITKQVQSKTEVSRPAPASDSRLTAVQREARDLYQARNGAGGSFDGAEHAVGEAASISHLLSQGSLGLGRINEFDGRIGRSFAGGGSRHMLGTEFAIVAIVAIAGIAKRRADLSYSGLPAIDGSEGKQKKPKHQAQINYQSPRLKMEKMRFQGGLAKDVPEWMISLDNSVAKEAGYLFSSVLKRPKILMTMSDTFVALAETHFHDAVLAWLIVDLNSHKIAETWKGKTMVVAISNGESIELPVWEDIVEFYQNKPKEARPDNLLTVVLKRNLDRELIEAALSAVIVPGQAEIVDGTAYGAEAGATVYRIRISGAAMRVHRLAYENFGKWLRMKKHFNRRAFRSRM